MDYHRLQLGLEKHGRDKLFAYVCDSFRPHLRRDKKYQQWRQMLNRVSLKVMSPQERHILGLLLEMRGYQLRDRVTNDYSS